MPTTAAGIDAETVIPAFKPRYTFAEPITTESINPMTITLMFSSGTSIDLFDIIMLSPKISD